jgi:hypothetical protein
VREGPHADVATPPVNDLPVSCRQVSGRCTLGVRAHQPARGTASPDLWCCTVVRDAAVALDVGALNSDPRVVIAGFVVLIVLAVIGAWRRKGRTKRRLQKMRSPVDGTLRVTAVTEPAFGSAYSSCTIDGVVQAPGLATRPVQISGMAPNEKWPQVGEDLPITVDQANPTNRLVRWDEVPTRTDQGYAAAQQLADQINSGSGGAPGGAFGPAGDALPPTGGAFRPRGGTFPPAPGASSADETSSGYPQGPPHTPQGNG